MCDELTNKKGAIAIFLFADINSEFYRKHSFIPLPEKFQKHSQSICMVKSEQSQDIWSKNGFQAPAYF